MVDRLHTARRLLGLRERYGDVRLEAACAKAVQFAEPAYVTIKRILVSGLEAEPAPAGAVPAPPARTFARSAAELLGHLFGGVRMELRHQLTPHLTKLRLSGILQTLEARDRQAVDGHWSYIEFLARLLEDEVERRGQRQLALRLRRATVNSTKTLETFDFAFNPTINRQQVLQLGSCDFVRQKRNVLICGPTGTGKTHLAQALLHEACRQGFDALFTTTHKMLQHIHGGRADGTLERRLQTYLRPDVLVLDDFGLKPIQAPGPERSLRRH